MNVSSANEWMEENGIGVGPKCPDDIKTILSYDFKDIWKMEHENVLEVIFKLSSYIGYLSNQLGISQSLLSYYDETYKNILYQQSGKLAGFYSTEERAAAARGANDKLQSMHDAVIYERYKYYRIKQFSEGVNKFLMALFKVLEYKKNEKHNSRKGATISDIS